MTKVGMQVSLSTDALNSLKYLSSEASKTIFKDVEEKSLSLKLKKSLIELKLLLLHLSEN